jgi:hypothetical protein
MNYMLLLIITSLLTMQKRIFQDCTNLRKYDRMWSSKGWSYPTKSSSLVFLFFHWVITESQEKHWHCFHGRQTNICKIRTHGEWSNMQIALSDYSTGSHFHNSVITNSHFCCNCDMNSIYQSKVSAVFLRKHFFNKHCVKMEIA